MLILSTQSQSLPEWAWQNSLVSSWSSRFVDHRGHLGILGEFTWFWNGLASLYRSGGHWSRCCWWWRISRPDLLKSPRNLFIMKMSISRLDLHLATLSANSSHQWEYCPHLALSFLTLPTLPASCLIRLKFWKLCLPFWLGSDPDTLPSDLSRMAFVMLRPMLSTIFSVIDVHL